MDKMVGNAKPFMQSRFNSEDIVLRPLPPVEVESHGTVELRTVKEIREQYIRPPPPPTAMGMGMMDGPPMLTLPGPAGAFMGDGHRRDSRGRKRDRDFDGHYRSEYPSSGDRDRGRDRDKDKDRGRDRDRERDGVPPSGDGLPREGDAQRSNFRKMASYLDVDAPNETAEMTVDYGVALLRPVKKRRSLTARKATVEP